MIDTPPLPITSHYYYQHMSLTYIKGGAIACLWCAPPPPPPSLLLLLQKKYCLRMHLRKSHHQPIRTCVKVLNVFVPFLPNTTGNDGNKLKDYNYKEKKFRNISLHLCVEVTRKNRCEESTKQHVNPISDKNVVTRKREKYQEIYFAPSRRTVPNNCKDNTFSF